MRIRIAVFHWMLAVCMAASLLAGSAARAGLGLHRVIPLSGVRGTFGPLAVDAAHRRLFVGVAGENQLLVINLANGAVTGRLMGLDRPQGLVYLAPQDVLAISNAGSGELGFYAAGSLVPDGAINFGASAGDLVYVAATHQVYLGYGDGAAGGIAIVSADAQPLDQFPLASHPAGFVVDPKAQRLYVNLPDHRALAVFDLASGRRVATWTLASGNGRNLAMALDATDERLFVVTNGPDRLLVLDSVNGRVLQTLSAPAGVGTLVYDAASRELYAAGGVGRLVVYTAAASGELEKSDDLPTGRGASHAVLDTTHGRYYLAIPARNRRPAEIWVYNVTTTDAGDGP